MSCYGWEQGTIKLPPAAAKSLRTKLNQHTEQRNAEAMTSVAGFYEHKGSGGRTPETFRAAMNDWDRNEREKIDKLRRRQYGGFSTETDRSRAAADAHEDAYEFVYRRMSKHELGKPLQRDLKAAFPKPPKTGAFTYGVGGEAVIAIDGNTVEWHVPENNHAVDRAREHPTARVFFGELSKVKWTKGTGGKITGNNEYNRDQTDVGGGANYEVGGYGPLGDPYFMTDAQKKGLAESAAKWRTKPGNAGKCGMRTVVNGRRTGPPCKNARHGCPAHGARPASYRGF